MQEFLNTQLKPYSELTREEKHILFDAHLDGNVECCYDKPEWYPLYKSDGFNDFTVYRTKPKEYKKLNVPWEFIEEEWKYAVMDGCETVLLYATKPEWLSEHNMWSCNHQYSSISPLKLDTTGIVAEHSLTQRPTDSNTQRPEVV